MYIAIVAIYIITCINFEKIFKEPAKSVDYCGSKTCLIKCCADGQYFDNDGVCREEKYFENVGFSRKKWDDLKTRISDIKKELSAYFMFILRENKLSPPKRNFTPGISYLLPEGFLYYEDESIRYRDVSPLHYCADHQLQIINDEVNVKLVYDLSKVPEELPKSDKSNKNEFAVIEYSVLGGGMLFTTLSIAIILCGLRKLRRDASMLNFVAYFITLICAYASKMLQLVVLTSGALDESETSCPFSGPMYFLILSAFCWPLVSTYDLMKSIRKIRKMKKVNYEINIGTFWRYCTFAWGLPLLITTITLILDKLDIGIEKPFLDNCFRVVNSTVLYLPVSILIIMNTILSITHTYNLWMANCSLNNPAVKESNGCIISAMAFRQMITSFILFIIIQHMPYQPEILFYATNTWLIMTWITYTFIFVFNTMKVMGLCKRITSNSNTDDYQVLKEDKSLIIDPMQNNIAVISNNELDKRKPLNFTYNIILVKDKIMTNIITQEYVKLENNPDLYKNGDDVISNHDIEKCENIYTDENSK